MGALSEACRLVHAGWSPRPVINSILLDYPTLSVDQAQQIQQYATEACAAAFLINQQPLDYVHKSHEVPHIREG